MGCQLVVQLQSSARNRTSDQIPLGRLKISIHHLSSIAVDSRVTLASSLSWQRQHSVACCFVVTMIAIRVLIKILELFALGPSCCSLLDSTYLPHGQIICNYYKVTLFDNFKILLTMALASLLIANYSSSSVLYHYRNPSFEHDINADAKLIVSKAKNLRSRVGERERLNCDYGAWFLLRGEEDLMYAACVSEDYPERVAFGLISKVQLSIKERSREGTVEKVIKKLQNQIGALCEKYKDPRVDKVREAQEAVNELRDELAKGVRTVFENQDNLSTLNQKTKLMTSYAKSFQKTAIVAQRKAYCKKYKVFLIIGVIIGSVLVVAGLVLFARMH